MSKSHISWYLRTMALSLALCAVMDQAKALEVITDPWLRVRDDIESLKINTGATAIVYESKAKPGLIHLNTYTRKYMTITNDFVNGAYLWSPDGFRIFYRALENHDSKITSVIKSFEIKTKKTDIIKKIDGPTGFLVYGINTREMQIMTPDGIQSFAIDYKNETKKPDPKLRTNNWIVTNKSILWYDTQLKKLKTVHNTEQDIKSFSLSNDLNKIAWSTADSRVYLSEKGLEAVYLSRGKDPQWHPFKPLLIYASARMLGSKIRDYDLRIVDIKQKNQKYLTNTPATEEVAPEWHPKGDKILYTKNRTTDIYLMQFGL